MKRPFRTPCTCHPDLGPGVSRAVHQLSRRGFLSALGLVTGGLALAQLVPSRAFAAGDPLKRRKFVFAYFEGGWDILVALARTAAPST